MIIKQETGIWAGENCCYACGELQKYAGQMAGLRLVPVPKAEAEIVLSTEPEDLATVREPLQYDGFSIAEEDGKIRICSRYPRGVLFAVYSILEENGCRFVKAAGISERIPKRSSLVITASGVNNPDYEWRGITLNTHSMNEVWGRHTMELVDWAAKNRINCIAVSETPEHDLEGEYRRVAQFVKDIGLIFEYGGHGTQNLLDRKLFEQHPEWFRMKNGKRTRDGNFCASNPESLRRVSDAVIGYLQRNPQGDIFDTIFEDGIEGMWCDCENCSGMTAFQQQTKVVNEIMRRVREEVDRPVRISMALYHETLKNVREIDRVEPGTLALYAPRERCYAHSFGDENCPQNAFYRDYLRDAADVFGMDNVYLFEYYFDFILFTKIKVNLVETLWKDIREYYDAGVRKITSLAFNHYSFWAYDANLHAYARATWNRKEDPKAWLDGYVRELAGKQSERFGAYQQLAQEFARNYFALCGYEGEFSDIRYLSVNDYTPVHLKKIERALEILKEMRAIVEELLPEAVGEFADYLKNERDLLLISEWEAESAYVRIFAKCEQKFNPNPDRADILQKIDAGIRALEKTIALIQNVDIEVKDTQGEGLFINHLCKDHLLGLHYLGNEFGGHYSCRVEKHIDEELKNRYEYKDLFGQE